MSINYPERGDRMIRKNLSKEQKQNAAISVFILAMGLLYIWIGCTFFDRGTEDHNVFVVFGHLLMLFDLWFFWDSVLL
jgi:hypothetical protein